MSYYRDITAISVDVSHMRFSHDKLSTTKYMFSVAVLRNIMYLTELLKMSNDENVSPNDKGDLISKNNRKLN